MKIKFNAGVILVLVLIALGVSVVATLASTLSWTDPGGSGLQITFTTPDTYYSCTSPGDRIYTTGIPGNWTLKGHVNVVVTLPDGSWQSVKYYTVNQSGDLDLTLSYPPAWTWPYLPPPADTRELHVDLAIVVRDEHGQIVPWVGGDPNLPGVLGPGQDWDVYCKEKGTPNLSITKYTNGADANDPNGTDVPTLKIGDPVTWTYHVTNTGNWSIHKSFIDVSDNQPGVSPVFNQEISGNGDDKLDPGEVWEYIATGTALDLSTPPQGVIVQEGVCTHDGTELPRTAYVNIGTVSIPGLSVSDPSSYCNSIYKVYLPMLSVSLPNEVQNKFDVFVGYEDLPLEPAGLNDFDYNDWLVSVDTEFFGVALDEQTINLEKVTFDMTPRARGATLAHEFRIRFPAGTFGSNGMATLTIRDENGNPISVQTVAFDSNTAYDVLIFDCTCKPLPPHGSVVNTIEMIPYTPPVLTAFLEIKLDSPAPFVLQGYKTHGEGLFFDPYIHVMYGGSPYDVAIGDIRTIVVPVKIWPWPEERVRIDKAYPLIVFNDPEWVDQWWEIYNDCVYGDGIICSIPGYLDLLRSEGLIK